MATESQHWTHAREGILWPMGNRGDDYDFARLDPLLDAMNRAQVLPCRDLCHYGYPDAAAPFAPDFADIMQESLAAVARGIDLHGVCLFPVVDMPDWHTGEWLHNGICDLVREGDDLRRVPYVPYIEELHRW